jgi:hypothetical protein
LQQDIPAFGATFPPPEGLDPDSEEDCHAYLSAANDVYSTYNHGVVIPATADMYFGE